MEFMDESPPLLPGGRPLPGRLLGWVGSTSSSPACLVQFFACHGFTFIPLSRHDLVACDLSLILIDCAGLSLDDVQEYLSVMQSTDPDLRQALLRVEPASPYEQLIRWPGVKGVFAPDFNESQLLNGVQNILAGQNWLPRRLLELCLEKQRGHVPQTRLPLLLTERERQILQHVGDASTNAQIAFDLCISQHTVKTHLYNIFRKIQVRNRMEAGNWIRQHMQGSVL